MSARISPLYAGRKRVNAIAMALCYAATAFGLMWLALILASLLINGLPGLSPAILLENTPPPSAQGGGLANAIVGSLMLTIIGLIFVLSRHDHAERNMALLWVSFIGPALQALHMALVARTVENEE